MRACGVRTIYPDPSRENLPDTSLTISAGPNLQIDHLHARGHRRLVYAAFTDPRTAALAAARHEAARARAGTLGLVPPDLARIDHRDESVEAAIRRWRDTSVTGVAAYNDDIAATVTIAADGDGVLRPRTEDPGTARPDCATRRFVISPTQSGGTRREVPGSNG
jgi:hypothetical protein